MWINYIKHKINKVRINRKGSEKKIKTYWGGCLANGHSKILKLILINLFKLTMSI